MTLPRLPLNGCDLVMALPMFRGDRISEWVVVVDRGDMVRDRYVVAWVGSLDSPTWSNGDYYMNVNDAVTRAYIRAHVHVMPWSEIERDAA